MTDNLNLEAQLRRETLQKSINEYEVYQKLLEEIEELIAEAMNVPSRLLHR